MSPTSFFAAIFVRKNRDRAVSKSKPEGTIGVGSAFSDSGPIYGRTPGAVFCRECRHDSSRSGA